MDDDAPPLVSPEDWANTPPDVQLAFLSLVDMVRDLSAQVRELRARLNQTSHNSSQPPSADPPSAPPTPASRVGRGRKRGGQLGQAERQRPLVPPEQVDTVVPLRPTICPLCQTALAADLPLSAPLWFCQIWEIPVIRPIVTEYQQQTVCCPHCQHAVTADLPPDIPPGAFGPRLTALIGLLHGGYHLSMRATADLLSDLAGIDISLGSIAAGSARVSAALAPLATTIQTAVQCQPYLWVDETSWREGTQRGWLWVAVSPLATCFRIDRSRGQAALQQLIGASYRGLVHSDRASAYHALPDGQRQLCWAHIARNLQGLLDHQHEESHWAQWMLEQVQALFLVWHAEQSGFFDQVALQQALIPVRLALHDLLRRGAERRWAKLQAFCQDLLRHWEGLWMFSRVEGMEPTNNRAERALRPAVVWRKSCYGTQSASGSRFVERMLSVQATCRQQGRNLFALLTAAVQAAWAKQPAPLIFCTP